MSLNLGSLRIMRAMHTAQVCAHCKGGFTSGELHFVLFQRAGNLRFTNRLHLTDCLTKFAEGLDASYKGKPRRRQTQRREPTMADKARKALRNRRTYLWGKIMRSESAAEIKKLGAEFISITQALDLDPTKNVRQTEEQRKAMRHRLMEVGLL
jgi:hypothetical protein